MLTPNHPHDERLAALASDEPDAAADATLKAHVASCIRCTGLIDELGALRAALADLPDVAPSRPLRLLPPVESAPASTADRLGGWARRFFGPVLASGAALALVGVIGTAAPSLDGMAAGGAEAGSFTLEAAGEQSASDSAEQAPAAADPSTEEMRSSGDSMTGTGVQGAATASPMAAYEAPEVAAEDRDGSDEAATLTQRSPWPMLLFAGVTLMIGAVLLRWILVPRTG